jgi:hypothetical protein
MSKRANRSKGERRGLSVVKTHDNRALRGGHDKWPPFFAP